MIRYPEIRYTPWIYGTDKKIEELFTTKPLELWKRKSEEELEAIAEQQIEKQIRTTHRIGQEANADVLDLEHRLYRHDYPTWKRLTSGGRSPLAPARLGEVKTTIKIASSGMYKMKRRMTPY